jgi:hypothetical protein
MADSETGQHVQFKGDPIRPVKLRNSAFEDKAMHENQKVCEQVKEIDVEELAPSEIADADLNSKKKQVCLMFSPGHVL